MSIQVKIPYPLQKLTEGQKSLSAEGSTVGELLDNLETRYPGFKARILNEQGEVHEFLSLYLNEEDIRFLQGLNTPVNDGDVLTILPLVAGGEGKAASPGIKVDQELDLRGEVCPYTFVKSKLMLEEMETGQVLRVIVNYLPSVTNVPRSMRNEGQEILEVTQLNGADWSITIRKVV